VTAHLDTQPHPIVIFVVDDEQLIADTLKVILKREGYDARAFYSPAAALEAALQCKPDLLLSDVRMPEIDGFELASIIEARCSDCKIVLLSAYFEELENGLPHAKQTQNWSIVLKPIQPTQLLALISRAVTHRQGRTRSL